MGPTLAQTTKMTRHPCLAKPMSRDFIPTALLIARVNVNTPPSRLPPISFLYRFAHESPLFCSSLALKVHNRPSVEVCASDCVVARGTLGIQRSRFLSANIAHMLPKGQVRDSSISFLSHLDAEPQGPNLRRSHIDTRNNLLAGALGQAPLPVIFSLF